MLQILLLVLVLTSAVSYPRLYETKKFRVGIEYEHSLPMTAGSDRYRHRNNYDPFFVTITASAKKGYVLSYLVVSATTDVSGDIEFCMITGNTGSRSMVFQVMSNNSEFLSYTYVAYGLKEEQYKKVTAVSFGGCN